jgi:RNA polymerase sigma-70 factor, ECF subfamily
MGDATHADALLGLSEATASQSSHTRLERTMVCYHEHVWRVLRNLGVPSGDLDDAVQQVFIVVARRLDEIRPESERAFLYGTAVRIASRARRSHARRREIVDPDPAAHLIAPHDPAQALHAAEQRALLDGALGALPDDLRAVLVMYEIEELTLAEIAAALEIPSGTAATRLRRARELFVAQARRLAARRSWEGGRR